MNMPPSNSARRFPSADSGGERRREPRRVLGNECLLTVRSPAWAMTPFPIVGHGRNISLIGMRIVGLRPETPQLTGWQEALREDVSLQVQVELTGVEGFPPLPGRLVWLHHDDQPDLYAVGILFSILKPDENSALKALITELPPLAS